MPVLTMVAILATQGTFQYKFAPKVGTVARYAMNQVTDSGPMGGKNTTSMTLTLKVLSKVGNSYRVESTLSNVKMVLPKGAPNAAASDKAAKSMEGTKFISLIDPTGKAKAEKNGNPSVESMINGFGGGGISAQFPGRPVKVGESWPITMDLQKLMGGAMSANGLGGKSSGNVKSSMKLVSISGNRINLNNTLTGTISMNMSGGKATGKGAPPSMSMKMIIDSTGTQSVEAATGMLIETTSKAKMTMSIMGQTVPVNMTMSLKRI
jgi:hypothetical protein